MRKTRTEMPETIALFEMPGDKQLDLFADDTDDTER